jgi:hypothetical protein
MHALPDAILTGSMRATFVELVPRCTMGPRGGQSSSKQRLVDADAATHVGFFGRERKVDSAGERVISSGTGCIDISGSHTRKGGPGPRGDDRNLAMQ